MRLLVKDKELKLLQEMVKRGYVVGEGNALRRIVRELNRINAPIVHGYSQKTRKVIVALESPLEIREWRKRGFTTRELKINFSLNRRRTQV